MKFETRYNVGDEIYTNALGVVRAAEVLKIKCTKTSKGEKVQYFVMHYCTKKNQWVEEDQTFSNKEEVIGQSLVHMFVDKDVLESVNGADVEWEESEDFKKSLDYERKLESKYDKKELAELKAKWFLEASNRIKRLS